MASATGDKRQAQRRDRGGRRRRTRATQPRQTHAAARCVMSPRGISRIAVRGLLRVVVGVHQPVESHRSTARGHHRHDDPAHLCPGHRRMARGQQRAGQRKRQREHGVREADEREIRAHGCDRALRVPEVRAEHGVDPVHAVRGNAAHQIFFHIDDVRRADRRRSGRYHGPARWCRPRRRSRAPGRRRASRSTAATTARTSGASRRRAASSENRFRSSLLARLSVPMATVTPAL